MILPPRLPRSPTALMSPWPPPSISIYCRFVQDRLELALGLLRYEP